MRSEKQTLDLPDGAKLLFGTTYDGDRPVGSTIEVLYWDDIGQPHGARMLLDAQQTLDFYEQVFSLGYRFEQGQKAWEKANPPQIPAAPPSLDNKSNGDFDDDIPF